MRPLERELAEAAEQVRRLRHELSEMTADRDSWEDQNSQRVDDALAAYKELDAEREKVRVLREALLAIFASDGSSGEYSTIRLADACEQARAALAATEPTP
jgi:septal ring factor EnvC (AmiA/AmiB activator)